MQQSRGAAAENCVAMEDTGAAAPTHPDVLLRESGITQPAIAAAMGVSLSAHMAYDQGGINALKPKPNGGRKHENMTLAEERPCSRALPKRPAPGRHRKSLNSAARTVLAIQLSASLRESLIEQLATINSSDEARASDPRLNHPSKIKQGPARLSKIKTTDGTRSPHRLDANQPSILSSRASHCTAIPKGARTGIAG